MKGNISKRKNNVSDDLNRWVKRFQQLLADLPGMLAKKADKANKTGGFEGGENADGYIGGAVGKNAAVRVGGGFAGGSEAKVNGNGVATGSGAKSEGGGAALGENTRARAGVAAGANARCERDESSPQGTIKMPIDAIQLGTGTNQNPKTVQAYNYQLMDANGEIPFDRIKSATDNLAEKLEVTNLKTNQTKIANVINGGGFAAGAGSNAYGGGAIGRESSAVNGFAGGLKSVASNGVAIGVEAKVANEMTPGGIDAIQLGTGTNPNPKTLQIYNHQLLDENGNIPAERLRDKVLTKGNTQAFSPAKDYDPATKKYVDENKGLQTAVIKNPQDWDSMIAKPDWGGVEVVRIETTGIPSPPCTVPKNVIAVIGTDKMRSSILPSTGSPFKITGHYECKLENVTADEIDGFLEVSNCHALSCDNCIYVHGSSMGATNNCTVVGLDRGDVLTKDNTEYYDPVDDYNPATKAYVDNKGAGFVANGTFSNLVNNTIKVANPAGGFGGGANARANGGGAVGMNAVTESGFAGGADAKTVNPSLGEIDAIQLGAGTNSNPKTLQVYNYQLMDATGKIPKERLPEITGGGDTTGILNNSVKIKNSAGGFAGGNATVMAGGAAIGNGAKVNDGIGGAVGASAQASQGGAIGQGATTSDGFAGGLNAKTVKSSSGPGGVVTEQRIDAIQLGTGTNPNAKTLQVYNYQLMDANGNVPKERLDKTVENGGILAVLAAAGFNVNQVTLPANGSAWQTGMENGVRPYVKTKLGSAGSLSGGQPKDPKFGRGYIVDSAGNAYIAVRTAIPMSEWEDTLQIYGYTPKSTSEKAFIAVFPNSFGISGDPKYSNLAAWLKTLNDSVLTKDNTTAYTPSANYQPATKKYVDDKVASAGGGGGGGGTPAPSYVKYDGYLDFCANSSSEWSQILQENDGEISSLPCDAYSMRIYDIFYRYAGFTPRMAKLYHYANAPGYETQQVTVTVGEEGFGKTLIRRKNGTNASWSSWA